MESVLPKTPVMKTFQLSPMLGISEVGELKIALSELVGSHPVSLCGKDVLRVDTAGLQLLLVFAREHREAGGKLDWVSPSQALTDAAKQLGLSSQLGLSAFVS